MFTNWVEITEQYKVQKLWCILAIAIGVKGGDDYRGPRGAPGDLNWLAEASLKRWSGQLMGHCCVSSRKLIICTFLNLANSKSLKHSNARRGKAELSTCSPCSVNTKRAASHGQQDQTELSFASPCTWKNKYKSQFKRVKKKRKICKRAKFSTSLQCSVHRGRAQRDMSQIARTPNLDLLALVPTYKKWCQNTRLG